MAIVSALLPFVNEMFFCFFLRCYAAVMKDAKHAPHESRKKKTRRLRSDTWEAPPRRCAFLGGDVICFVFLWSRKHAYETQLFHLKYVFHAAVIHHHDNNF